MQPAVPSQQSGTDPGPPGEGFGVVEDSYHGEGPRVVVLGDSIMVAAADALREELDGYATKFAVLAGEGLAGGALSTLLQGNDMVDVARRYGQDQPAIVVLGLGTNDVLRPELSTSQALGALTEVVRSLEGAVLVVAPIADRLHHGELDPDDVAEINQALTAVADELVDWPAIAARPGCLRPDGIHPTEAGAQQLATATAAAVRRCR